MSYNTFFNSDLSVTNSACKTDVCDYAVNLPPSICSTSAAATINVTVSATNRLGAGPSSDPVATGMWIIVQKVILISLEMLFGV